MRDQAEKLRMMMQGELGKQAKTIAVVSGKGGVGKSNISINMAVILAQKGHKVLLFDLDIGMGNVNILLGRSFPKTISDYLQNDLPIQDIIHQGGDGVSYIAGGNGLNEVATMDMYMAERLLAGLELLQNQFDYIIFDMAAGAASATLQVLLSADDIIVVTTPEPTAIMDAYSMMKFICLEGFNSRFMLICNRADSEKQGKDTLIRLQQAAHKFLQQEINLLGIVPEDKNVRKAVIAQNAFYRQFPASEAAKSLEKIVEKYMDGNIGTQLTNKESFIGKIRRLFLEKEERGWRK